MSHVISVKVVVQNLDALERAAKSLGMELNRGKRTYRWFGSWVGDYQLPVGFTAEQLGHCDHTLSIPGNKNAYEVGVVKQADGTYILLFDFWSGGYGLEKAIGKGAEKLISEYAMAAAESKASELGWYCERNGQELQIYVPGGGTLHVTHDSVDAIGFIGASCAEATQAISAALGVEVDARRKSEYGLVQNTNNVIQG